MNPPGSFSLYKICYLLRVPRYLVRLSGWHLAPSCKCPPENPKRIGRPTSVRRTSKRNGIRVRDRGRF